MEVFLHHIYEYKKGLRNLVLHTMPASKRTMAEQKLKQQGISFTIMEVNRTKINVFFGAGPCIEVVKSFGYKPLNMFTPEEDFILGTMLGYDRLQQCNRYIQRKEATVYNEVSIRVA